MTLKFLDPFGTGKLVLFQVTYDKVSLTLAMLVAPDSSLHRIGMRRNYCFS
jgi:hypothetical protein